jgi:hypothetical protein
LIFLRQERVESLFKKCERFAVRIGNGHRP